MTKRVTKDFMVALTRVFLVDVRAKDAKSAVEKATAIMRKLETRETDEIFEAPETTLLTVTDEETGEMVLYGD